MTHNKPFSLEVTTVSEFCWGIMVILDDTIFSLYQPLYNILWLVSLWCSRQIPNKTLEMFHLCSWYTLYTNVYVQYNMIIEHCVLLPHIHYQMLLPNQMSYAYFHHTLILLTIDIPLFMIWIHGYTSSTIRSINFELLCQTPTRN